MNTLKRSFCNKFAMPLTAALTALILTGCEIDMVYLDDGYPPQDQNPPEGLSIRSTDAESLSQILFDLEALSLLPADVARMPGYFMSDGGSDLAVSPLLTLLNRVGNQFFLSSDWQDLGCAEVTRNHRDESELFGHQLQGHFVAKWNASDCYGSDYLGLNPEFRSNLDSFVTWNEDLQDDEIHQLSALTKLDWRFDNPWGGVLLEQSSIRTYMDGWGWLNSDFSLKMNIDSGWQSGSLIIETVEPLVFAPGSAIASSGWIQLRTGEDVLDVRVLSDSIRVFHNNRWIDDF